MRPILREGEAAGGWKVERIDVEAGTVGLLRHGGDSQILDLGLTPAERIARRTLYLRAADLSQVLEVYQELSGRTVIRSATMPITKIDCNSAADFSPESAVGILTNSLKKAGTVVTLIGAKFAVAGTKRDEDRIRSLKPPPAIVPGEETFAPGLMKFHEADLAQVLPVYAELIGRPMKPPQRLTPPIKVTVRSQTRLNHREAAWLLEACLHMAGMPVWPEHTN